MSSSVFRVVAGCVAMLALSLPLSASLAASASSVYVALGDSYTSGPLIPVQHGNPIGCARSDHNYPSLVAAGTHPGVFRDVSCGSAVTDNMTQPQSVPGGGVNPPQFGALSPDATLVTVGIGGNDADLVGIAESCIKFDAFSPTGSPCKDHYTVNGRDTAVAGVDAIAPKIAGVLRGIHSRSPHARTLLVGYPAVLPLSGPGCWPVVPLSSGDVPWFRSLLVRINSVLAQQARANGAEYVDTYTASEGHDVCTVPGTRWFEGVLPSAPAYPLHPNALGEESMSRSVLSVLSHAPPPGSHAGPPGSNPSTKPRASHLRITWWRFRGVRLIVRGTVSSAYHGRLVVSFAAGAHHRVRARTSVRVRRGHWRAVLMPRGQRGGDVPSGELKATSRARDGLRAGRAQVRTRAAELSRG